jgi:hypothetical protein
MNLYRSWKKNGKMSARNQARNLSSKEIILRAAAAAAAMDRVMVKKTEEKLPVQMQEGVEGDVADLCKAADLVIEEEGDTVVALQEVAVRVDPMHGVSEEEEEIEMPRTKVDLRLRVQLV